MSEKHWSDRMNEEYEAAKNDADRLAILERYMSPMSAASALSHMTTSDGDVKDLWKLRKRARKSSAG